MMARSRPDPVLGFNFSVSLVETASAGATIQATLGVAPRQAGFSECSGLEVALQPETYAEGGNNGAMLKFTGRATWTNIRLKRGIVTTADLWQWHYDYLEGHGKRRDGVITLQDERGKAVRSWRFKRGLPVRWVGPSLNAIQSQVAVEEIEIAHEGIRATGAGGGNLVSAVSNLFS